MSRPRQLGSLVGPVTRAALGRKASALGALLADWSTVVGPETAAIALPEKLAFPKDRQASGARERQDSATLTLRVDPSRALELQHDLPRLVERINGHFGYRAIDRIKLVQGKPAATPAPRKPPPPAPADEAAIDGLVEGIGDDDLKQRLAALGRALWSRTAEAKDG